MGTSSSDRLVILILIAMIKTVAPMIKSGVLGTLTKWSGIVDSMTNNNGEFPEEKKYGADITDIYKLTALANPIYVDGKLMETSGDVIIPGEVKYKKDPSIYFLDGLWHKVKEVNAFLSNKSDITSVIIKDGVEKVDAGAFTNCKNLISVIMADSVTEMGEQTFAGCSNLKTIKLSDNIKIIKNKTFYESTMLNEITLPKNIEKIESYAFYESGIKNISLPKNLISLGDYAFRDCENLENVTFEGSIDIPFSCFYNCKNLKTITFANDKPINISTNAFEGCKSLQKVLFPDCVEELKENSFVNCNSLSYVKLPNNLKSIKNSFWRNSNLSSIEHKGIIYTSRSTIEQALTDNGVTYGNNTFDSLGLTD